MEVVLKKTFIKAITKLPIKIQLSIKEIIDQLQKADQIQDLKIDIKRMEGQKSNENYYRIRVGSYRIGIELIEPLVIVITVLSRGDIYKNFPPK